MNLAWVTGSTEDTITLNVSTALTFKSMKDLERALNNPTLTWPSTGPFTLVELRPAIARRSVMTVFTEQVGLLDGPDSEGVE
jgi:hypothetical protein